MAEKLLILGDAPCLSSDLDHVLPFSGSIMAINRAGLRYREPIDFWCTYHPEKFWQEWRRNRASLGGNENFLEITDRDVRNIPISGSSVLLGIIWGLARFESIIVAGAPLNDDGYHMYRKGWENEASIIAGRVTSLSGWTKTFLEGLNHGA